VAEIKNQHMGFIEFEMDKLIFEEMTQSISQLKSSAKDKVGELRCDGKVENFNYN